MTDMIHKGGCACGAVRYRINGEVRGVLYCHCTQCRRQTGHFLASSACEDADLTIEGDAQISWFQSSPEAQRGFCKICGSGLFWKNSTKSYTSILAGSFDDPNSLVADSHIFVADKGSYYTIDDGLPCHDTAPSGLVSTVD